MKMVSSMARVSPSPNGPDGDVGVIGGPHERVADAEARAFIRAALDRQALDGRNVVVIVPDATRSCPLPFLLSCVHEALVERVRGMTFLVALGTHAPMSESALAAHLGYRPQELDATYPGVRVLNHEWWDPATFVSVGTISGSRLSELSGGLLSEPVDVRINRVVVDSDVALIVGPVFPHEVVGFSGGNKYLFPGVAGQDIIDISHWLGALITSASIIGTRAVTPVRALIDEAASLICAPKTALCLVVGSGSGALHAVTFGSSEHAWAAAAEIAAETHVRYLDAPVKRVLSIIPPKYDDIWTAAKGFYKLEPVVADGGEVILYAPHVHRLSAMHPEIERIGYHCRDYFVGQWDRFKHLHWGVLAHSTHLRGAGSWDAETGERCRLQVTLATGIPEDVVQRANLGYLDPSTMDLDTYAADPDTLVVPNAGEVLFRLR